MLGSFMIPVDTQGLRLRSRSNHSISSQFKSASQSQQFITEVKGVDRPEILVFCPVVLVHREFELQAYSSIAFHPKP